MDALVCNGLGIYCGLQSLKYFSMKTYHWRGLWNIPTYRYSKEEALIIISLTCRKDLSSLLYLSFFRVKKMVEHMAKIICCVLHVGGPYTCIFLHNVCYSDCLFVFSLLLQGTHRWEASS